MVVGLFPPHQNTRSHVFCASASSALLGMQVLTRLPSYSSHTAAASTGKCTGARRAADSSRQTCYQLEETPPPLSDPFLPQLQVPANARAPTMQPTVVSVRLSTLAAGHGNADLLAHKRPPCTAVESASQGPGAQRAAHGSELQPGQLEQQDFLQLQHRGPQRGWRQPRPRREVHDALRAARAHARQLAWCCSAAGGAPIAQVAPRRALALPW